jgi:hypothetical protein
MPKQWRSNLKGDKLTVADPSHVGYRVLRWNKQGDPLFRMHLCASRLFV